MDASPRASRSVGVYTGAAPDIEVSDGSRSEIGEEEFLKATEYRQRWGYDWGLYRPIVEFSRRNGIALAGLNVPSELRQRLHPT